MGKKRTKKSKVVPVVANVSDPTFSTIPGMPGYHEVAGTITLTDVDEEIYHVGVVNAATGAEIVSMEQDGAVQYPSPGIRKYKYKTNGAFLPTGTSVKIIAYVIKYSSYSGNADAP